MANEKYISQFTGEQIDDAFAQLMAGETTRNSAYQTAEEGRDATFAGKEATRDAANAAALAASDSIAQLGREINGSTKNYQEGYVLNYSASTRGTIGTSAGGAVCASNSYIPVQGGETVEWYSGASADYADRQKLSLVAYNADKQIVSAYNTTATNGWAVKTITLPSNSGIAFIRGSFVLANLSQCYIKINGVVAWRPTDNYTGQGQRITTLENGLSDLQTSVDTQIEGLETNITTLENGLSDLQTSVDTQIEGLETNITTLENGIKEDVSDVEKKTSEKIFNTAGMLDGNVEQYLTIEAGGISSGADTSNGNSIRTKGFIDHPSIKVALGTGKKMLVAGYNEDGSWKRNDSYGWRSTGGEFSFATKYRIVFRTSPETPITPADFESFGVRVTVYDASVKKALIPSDVVNDLTTGGARVPLSAQQGVALKTEIDAIKGPGTTTALNNLGTIASFLSGYTTADSLQALLAAIASRLITFDDCSTALQQLILSGGGGEVVNNPDDEDLTVVGGFLKFKNKDYSPAAFSGLGRIFLRKNIVGGSNIISSSMFPTANTIYVVQYAYAFAASEPTISLPSNCILLFHGGSFSGGSMVLDNTTILGTDDGFRNMEVTGTVKNDKVESRWFYNGGADFAQDWINIVSIANASQRDIVFKKGSYTIGDGVMNGATPVIRCATSVDFAGSEITLAPTGEHLYLAFRNSESEDIEITSELVSEINAKPNKFSTLADCCLLITDSNTEEVVRHSSSTRYNRKEYLYIDKDGYRQNDYFGDTISPTSIKKIDCSKSSKVSNVRIRLTDGFTGTQSSNYRFIGLRFSASSNLTFENIQMDIDCQNYKLNYVYGDSGYNIRFINFRSRNTADATSVSGANVNSSYVFHFYHIIKLTMESVKVSGLTNSGWGATGTNYITDWTIRDSELSRIDNHIRLNNLYVYNSIIGNKGIHYTGWGEMIIENSTFIGCTNAMQPREDYGSFFDGNITLRNIRLIGVGAVLGIQLYNDDFGLDYHADAVGCRKLTIDGLRVENAPSDFKLLKVTGNVPLETKVMPHFKARNIESLYLTLCNRGWSEQSVLGDNDLRFDIEGSDLRGCGLFEAGSSTTGNKIAKVKLVNCENVKMGTNDSALIEMYGCTVTDMASDTNGYYIHNSRLVLNEISEVGTGSIDMIGCVLDIAQGLSQAEKLAVKTLYNGDLQGSNVKKSSCVNTDALDDVL